MKWGVGFVALLAALVLLPGLQGPGPFDVHEAQDLQVARELIEARGGLTPVLGSEPLFEKPLLAYAPEVLTLLGARARALEASRAWRAALAVLLVLLTAATTARHLGGRAGVCAAGVLATSLVLPLAARLDGTQLMASLLAWIAVDGFMHAWFGGRSGRDARLAISYATLGCALVVAGPMAALWPLGAAAIYQGLTRRSGAWRALRPGAGVLIIAGLALPWYGAELERHGFGFLGHVVFYPYGLASHAGWFLGPFLAVSFAVVGFFPWSAMLPGALRHAAMWWRTPRVAPAGMPAGAPDLAPLARELGEERAAHWFIACAMAALLPLLLYPHAPLTASLAALPALAALCGRMFDHLIEDQARVGESVRRGAQLLAMTGTVGAVLLGMVSSRVGDAAPAVRLLATTVFVTSWLPFLAALTGRFRLAALLMVLPIAAGAPITSGQVVPIVEGYITSRPVALAAQHRVPPRAPLVLFDDPPPSLRFLTRHNLVRAEWYDGPLRAPRAADGFVYLAYRPAREESVRASVARDSAVLGVLEVLARSPGLVLARAKA